MPNIRPVSDLRNYTELLKSVTYGNRVYLTRNGQGEYVLLSMSELDEIEKRLAKYQLLLKLEKAEERAEREGWHSADEVKRMLGAMR